MTPHKSNLQSYGRNGEIDLLPAACYGSQHESALIDTYRSLATECDTHAVNVEDRFSSVSLARHLQSLCCQPSLWYREIPEPWRRSILVNCNWLSLFRLLPKACLRCRMRNDNSWTLHLIHNNSLMWTT